MLPGKPGKPDIIREFFICKGSSGKLREIRKNYGKIFIILNHGCRYI